MRYSSKTAMIKLHIELSADGNLRFSPPPPHSLTPRLSQTLPASSQTAEFNTVLMKLI